MVVRLPRAIMLLVAVGFCSELATADSIGVGLLTFDLDTATAPAAFDITNLTGMNASVPDFPVTTPLTITVTNLTANLLGGGTITINASDFSVVDTQGDVNCTVVGFAASGGCDFSPYNIVSATLTGTLSPTTGIAGLPPGDTGILSTFSTTITPNVGCGPMGGTTTTLTAGCDVAVINASAVPEPATPIVPALLMIGLLVSYKLRRTGNVRAI